MCACADRTDTGAEFAFVHTVALQFVYNLNFHSCKAKNFQIGQRNLIEKHSNLLF